jgi:hypothetical protein
LKNLKPFFKPGGPWAYVVAWLTGNSEVIGSSVGLVLGTFLYGQPMKSSEQTPVAEPSRVYHCTIGQSDAEIRKRLDNSGLKMTPDSTQPFDG